MSSTYSSIKLPIDCYTLTWFYYRFQNPLYRITVSYNQWLGLLLRKLLRIPYLKQAWDYNIHILTHAHNFTCINALCEFVGCVLHALNLWVRKITRPGEIPAHIRWTGHLPNFWRARVVPQWPPTFVVADGVSDPPQICLV